MKKRTLRILSSVLVVVIVVQIAGLFCNHPYDNAERTIESFYNQHDTEIDYLVIGASCGYNDMIPVVAWENQGLTGACLCLDSAYFSMYEFILNEALEKYENFVLIVDLDGFLVNPEDIHKNSSRIWIDCQRKNMNWINAIEKLDNEHRVEHYFPILRYHNQATVFYSFLPQTLSKIKNYIKPKPDIMFGANVKTKGEFSKNKQEDYYVMQSNITEKSRPNDEVLKTFENFVLKCKNSNLKDVIFVNFPKMYSDDDEYQIRLEEKKWINFYDEIISVNEYKLIDFYDDSIELDLDNLDFSDSAHLNYRGAEKLTKYLSNSIADNYFFIEKSDDIVEIWNESYMMASKKYGFGE